MSITIWRIKKAGNAKAVICLLVVRKGRLNNIMFYNNKCNIIIIDGFFIVPCFFCIFNNIFNVIIFVRRYLEKS